MAMKSSVPYLLRAINEWILDNGCTPYLFVDTEIENVNVPMDYAKDGQIVLNISPGAIRDLAISQDYVMFSGRFGGRSHEISMPMAAVLGIVAKENGEGMWFPREDFKPDLPPESSTITDKPDKPEDSGGEKRAPNLKLVE